MKQGATGAASYGSVYEYLERAASGPGSVTFVRRDGSEQLGYAELFARAHRLAGGLAEAGIGPGRIVGVLGTRTFDFFVSCIAIWRCGAGVLLLAPKGRWTRAGSWVENVQRLLKAAQVDAVLADETNGPFDVDIPMLAADKLPSKDPPKHEIPPPTAVALIQPTSGTSDEPKASVVTYQGLWHRAVVREEGPEPEGGGYLIWSPPHLGSGFSSGLLRPLSHRASTTILDTSLFAADPGRWLREVSERRISHSGGAHTAYRMALKSLQDGGEGKLDLSHWRAANDGGEPIDPDSAIEFIRRAERWGFSPDAFRPRYAMTEASFVSSRAGVKIDNLDRTALTEGLARTAGQGDKGAQFVSVGEPHEEVDLQITTTDNECGDREIGDIRIKSPKLADRYLSGPLRGADGWFHTGDMGYRADGELYITGRSKDVIIIRGRNLIASDIERLVETVPHVKPGRTAALGVGGDGPERLVIVAELLSPASDDCRKEVVRSLWREAGVVGVEVVFTEPDSLPVTAGGKLSKAEIKAAYESGRLTTLD